MDFRTTLQVYTSVLTILSDRLSSNMEGQPDNAYVRGVLDATTGVVVDLEAFLEECVD